MSAPMMRSRRQAFTVGVLDVYLGLIFLLTLFAIGALIVGLITRLHDARLYYDSWLARPAEIWSVFVAAVLIALLSALFFTIPVLVIRDVLDHLARANQQLEELRDVALMDSR